MDQYTPEEFANKLKLRGYIAQIAEARKTVSEWGKPFYTEEDFEEAYHRSKKEYIGRNPIRGLASDGQNMFSASGMRNSSKGNMWEINYNLKMADMEDQKRRDQALEE